MKTLFLKPGTLSLEFQANKRSSYLSPIRLYLFSSLLFFVLVVSWGTGVLYEFGPGRVYSDMNKHMESLLGTDTEKANELMDELMSEIDTGSAISRFEEERAALYGYDPGTVVRSFLVQQMEEVLARPGRYWDKRVMVSILACIEDPDRGDLPRISMVETWIKLLHQGSAELYSSHGDNSTLIMIILLPWLLGITAILNARKKVRLVHHLVFCMHVFTTIFLLLSLEILLSYCLVEVMVKIPSTYGYIRYVERSFSFVAYFVIAVHVYLSFRKFYGDGHFIAIMKYLVVLLLVGAGWVAGSQLILWYTLINI